MLPPRIPKKAKRASRWRSPAHCNFVRSHACCMPGCAGRPIEVAHVRKGGHAGMGQRPDDFRTVSLCAEHHRRQHNIGEASFWRGIDVEGIMDAFAKASPKARDIAAIKRERGL